MKIEYERIELGPAPSKVSAATPDEKGYAWRAWHETRAYVAQCLRQFGPPPAGCMFLVSKIPNGPVSRLVVTFNWPKHSKDGKAYADRCLAARPAEWDAEARADLGLDLPPPLLKRPRRRSVVRPASPHSKKGARP